MRNGTSGQGRPSVGAKDVSEVGSNRRLPLVDSLRAGAALLIFAYHALFVTGNLSSTHYGWYLNIGVPLFYAISGLLLFGPFAGHLIEGSAPSGIRSYARHRLFRIVPAYWIALPLVAVLLGRVGQVFTPSGVLTYFGMAQAYSLKTFVGGIGQAWTLTVEVAFYAFLPFWAWLCSAALSGCESELQRVRRLIVLVGGLVLASIGWKLAVVHHVGNDIPSAVVPLTALPAALDQFCVGMLVSILVLARKREIGSGRVLGFFSEWPAVGIFCAAAAYWGIGEIDGVGLFSGSPLFGRGARTIIEHEGKALFAAGLLLAGVAASPGFGVVGRVLAWRPLRWVGEVSYGFYLWHLALLTVVAGNAKWALGDHGLIANPSGVGVTASWQLISLAVAIAFVASLVVAWISWQWIERPFIRRSHSTASETSSIR